MHMIIDKEEILNDLNQLMKLLQHTVGFSNNLKLMRDFYTWNEVLSYLSPSVVAEEFYITPYILKALLKQNKKSDRDYDNSIMNEQPYIEECRQNYSELLENINFINFRYVNHRKIFSYKEVKELILSFFNQFDNNSFKIVKSVFDESKCHIGVDFYDDFSGCCCTNLTLNKSLIFLGNENFRLYDIMVLAHELGHYIEISKFVLPQSKGYSFFSTFREVSSMFYEYEFLKYLQKNHFQLKSTNDLLNLYYSNILEYFNAYSTIMSEEFYDEETLSDTIIYSMGPYMALHFSELKKQDYKRFECIFNNFISNIDIGNFETLMKISEFNIEDFLSGDLIKDTIKEDFTLMKKQYKVGI